MINQLVNQNIAVAQNIHSVLQSSYAVEARLLGVTDFPALRRPIDSFINNENTFLGYFLEKRLAGVIDLAVKSSFVDINSLVVKPEFFRQGIANQLLIYISESYDVEECIVETGLDNLLAIELYKKHGLIEVKPLDTDFGVRKVQYTKKI